MLKITRDEYDRLNKAKKIHLANSLSGYKSLNLIASQSKDGNENVAIFSSVTHYGSIPPIFGVVLRPPTPRHQTYRFIKEHGFFTINQINQSLYEKAHNSSATLPDDVSEFDFCKITHWHSPSFPCPFVKESQIKMGMKYTEEHLISNGTVLVLGTVEEIHIEERLLEATGHIDHQTAQTITVTGLDSYYLPKFLKRLNRVN